MKKNKVKDDKSIIKWVEKKELLGIVVGIDGNIFTDNEGKYKIVKNGQDPPEDMYSCIIYVDRLPVIDSLTGIAEWIDANVDFEFDEVDPLQLINVMYSQQCLESNDMEDVLIRIFDILVDSAVRIVIINHKILIVWEY